MSEPLSDALFGVDGTELPEPLLEPSGRGASDLPLMTLPSLFDSRMTREEVAAALGEAPGAAQGDTPVDAAPVGVPSAAVPPVTTPPAPVTAPLPAHTHSAPSAAPPPVPPVPPSSDRSSGRYRPSLPVGSRLSGQRGLRSRAGRRGPGLPHPRSNGGATIFFVVAVVLAGVLASGIAFDIVASLARLVP